MPLGDNGIEADAVTEFDGNSDDDVIKFVPRELKVEELELRKLELRDAEVDIVIIEDWAVEVET